MYATPVLAKSGLEAPAIDGAAMPSIHPPAPELAIVVSGMNDPAGRSAFLARIGGALPGVAWQLIVLVDDAEQDPADLARRDADPRLRIVGKAGPRGLSSDRVVGMLATDASYVAVIGDDLRRDPALLAPMLRLARAGSADLVVVSRHLARTMAGDRRDASACAGRIAARLASAAGRPPLSDPMSDSFLIRHAFVRKHLGDLVGGGAELLLDILLATRRQPPRVVELPSPATGRPGGGGATWRVAMRAGRVLHDMGRVTTRGAAQALTVLSRAVWPPSPPASRRQVR